MLTLLRSYGNFGQQPAPLLWQVVQQIRHLRFDTS